MKSSEKPPASSRSDLIAAVTSLLDSGVKDPNVSQVVRAAGVSRPTFYQHFEHMPALLRAAVQQRLAQVFTTVAPESMGDAWPQLLHGTLVDLLKELDRFRTFYRTAFHGPAAFTLLQDAVEFLSRRILDVSPLGPVILRTVGPSLAREHTEALAAGVTWNVLTWLGEDSTTESLDATAERLEMLLWTTSGADRSQPTGPHENHPTPKETS